MKTITTITNEIVYDMEGLKKILVEQIAKEDVLFDMDSAGFEALKISFKLIDESSELMKEYAEMLEEYDRKLDMILEKLNKERA